MTDLRSHFIATLQPGRWIGDQVGGLTQGHVQKGHSQDWKAGLAPKLTLLTPVVCSQSCPHVIPEGALSDFDSFIGRNLPYAGSKVDCRGLDSILLQIQW